MMEKIKNRKESNRKDQTGSCYGQLFSRYKAERRGRNRKSVGAEVDGGGCALRPKIVGVTVVGVIRQQLILLSDLVETFRKEVFRTFAK